jgi:hypothetical protein
MSAPKLTPWFPGHIKPVRPGVYQRASLTYSYWTGAHWVASADTVQEAARPTFFDLPSCVQDWSWRGLAEEPK